MVSLRQTSLKYRGRKAETYDEIREKQARWRLENETVGRWLREIKPADILDCPVGTGRFLPLYADLSVESVHAVDISEEMLALARKKAPRAMKAYCNLEFQVASATEIPSSDTVYHVTVCVRFLDLIDEEAMRAVITELSRVTRSHLICTIRLGPKYAPKSNTAEHDSKKFYALLRRLGWSLREKVLFREGDWHILWLEKKQ
jgi:ubiquinone/menaquinone biosynthesis C-methylase UbiE